MSEAFEEGIFLSSALATCLHGPAKPQALEDDYTSAALSKASIGKSERSLRQVCEKRRLHSSDLSKGQLPSASGSLRWSSMASIGGSLSMVSRDSSPQEDFVHRSRSTLLDWKKADGEAVPEHWMRYPIPGGSQDSTSIGSSLSSRTESREGKEAGTGFDWSIFIPSDDVLDVDTDSEDEDDDGTFGFEEIDEDQARKMQLLSRKLAISTMSAQELEWELLEVNEALEARVRKTDRSKTKVMKRLERDEQQASPGSRAVSNLQLQSFAGSQSGEEQSEVTSSEDEEVVQKDASRVEEPKSASKQQMKSPAELWASIDWDPQESQPNVEAVETTDGEKESRADSLLARLQSASPAPPASPSPKYFQMEATPKKKPPVRKSSGEGDANLSAPSLLAANIAAKYSEQRKKLLETDRTGLRMVESNGQEEEEVQEEVQTVPPPPPKAAPKAAPPQRKPETKLRSAQVSKNKPGKQHVAPPLVEQEEEPNPLAGLQEALSRLKLQGEPVESDKAPADGQQRQRAPSENARSFYRTASNISALGNSRVQTRRNSVEGVESAPRALRDILGGGDSPVDDGQAAAPPVRNTDSGRPSFTYLAAAAARRRSMEAESAGDLVFYGNGGILDLRQLGRQENEQSRSPSPTADEDGMLRTESSRSQGLQHMDSRQRSVAMVGLTDEEMNQLRIDIPAARGSTSTERPSAATAADTPSKSRAQAHSKPRRGRPNKANARKLEWALHRRGSSASAGDAEVAINARKTGHATVGVHTFNDIHGPSSARLGGARQDGSAEEDVVGRTTSQRLQSTTGGKKAMRIASVLRPLRALRGLMQRVELDIVRRDGDLAGSADAAGSSKQNVQLAAQPKEFDMRILPEKGTPVHAAPLGDVGGAFGVPGARADSGAPRRIRVLIPAAARSLQLLSEQLLCSAEARRRSSRDKARMFQGRKLLRGRRVLGHKPEMIAISGGGSHLTGEAAGAASALLSSAGWASLARGAAFNHAPFHPDLQDAGVLGSTQITAEARRQQHRSEVPSREHIHSMPEDEDKYPPFVRRLLQMRKSQDVSRRSAADGALAELVAVGVALLQCVSAPKRILHPASQDPVAIPSPETSSAWFQRQRWGRPRKGLSLAAAMRATSASREAGRRKRTLMQSHAPLAKHARLVRDVEGRHASDASDASSSLLSNLSKDAPHIDDLWKAGQEHVRDRTIRQLRCLREMLIARHGSLEKAFTSMVAEAASQALSHVAFAKVALRLGFSASDTAAMFRLLARLPLSAADRLSLPFPAVVSGDASADPFGDGESSAISSAMFADAMSMALPVQSLQRLRSRIQKLKLDPDSIFDLCDPSPEGLARVSRLSGVFAGIGIPWTESRPLLRQMGMQVETRHYRACSASIVTPMVSRRAFVLCLRHADAFGVSQRVREVVLASLATLGGDASPESPEGLSAQDIALFQELLRMVELGAKDALNRPVTPQTLQETFGVVGLSAQDALSLLRLAELSEGQADNALSMQQIAIIAVAGVGWRHDLLREAIASPQVEGQSAACSSVAHGLPPTTLAPLGLPTHPLGPWSAALASEPSPRRHPRRREPLKAHIPAVTSMQQELARPLLSSPEKFSVGPSTASSPAGCATATPPSTAQSSIRPSEPPLTWRSYVSRAGPQTQGMPDSAKLPDAAQRTWPQAQNLNSPRQHGHPARERTFADEALAVSGWGQRPATGSAPAAKPVLSPRRPATRGAASGCLPLPAILPSGMSSPQRTRSNPSPQDKSIGKLPLGITGTPASAASSGLTSPAEVAGAQ